MDEITFMGDVYEVVSEPFVEGGQVWVWAYNGYEYAKSPHRSRTDPFLSCTTR